MKTIFLFLFLSNFIYHISFCQGVGEWTWMSGDSVSQKEGVYGIQGVPSVLNHPPTLYEGCEWKDNSGNFWFYGGIHADSMGLIVTYGDLWRFKPATLEWTWMNGPGIPAQSPVYGTLRVPAAGNYPGGKCFGSISITDHNGIFWMYGGYNHNLTMYYSDLWSYDPSTNLWTWMSGQTTNLYPGTFGTNGIPSPLNSPPAKQESNAGWVDSLNNIWIFGGQLPTGNGNDLWKFDVMSYEWTWMKGSSAINGAGVYGIREVPDPANTPGARMVYSRWTDSDNNFWLFAGVDSGGAYNDMWKYEVSTNQWTWMNGSSSAGSTGFLDSLCHPSALNCPSARIENRSAWKDNCDNMYTFGGFGPCDVWVYNRFTNMWSKLFESIDQPTFGIMGISSALNTPGAKGGASAWIDGNKNLWLFGGLTAGLGYMGDMWRYVTDSACIAGCAQAVPIAGFSAAQNLICPGTCANFSNYSYYASNYSWQFPGASPDTSTAVNPTNICYANSGSYDVQLIATNANGSDTLTLQNYITVFPQPPAQSITQSGDTLFAIAGSSLYQWFFNGNSISGATDYFYVATASGDYNVVATDTNGCEVEAVINDVIASAQAAVGSGSMQSIQVYPNPVTETFDIRGLKNNIADEIKIFNVFGEKVFEAVNCKLSAQADPSFGGPIANCQLFPAGLYYIEIKSDNKIYRTNFVKQ